MAPFHRQRAYSYLSHCPAPPSTREKKNLHIVTGSLTTWCLSHLAETQWALLPSFRLLSDSTTHCYQSTALLPKSISSKAQGRNFCQSTLYMNSLVAFL